MYPYVYIDIWSREKSCPKNFDPTPGSRNLLKIT